MLYIIVSGRRVSTIFVSPRSFPNSKALAGDDTNEFDAIHPIDLYRRGAPRTSNFLQNPNATCPFTIWKLTRNDSCSVSLRTEGSSSIKTLQFIIMNKKIIINILPVRPRRRRASRYIILCIVCLSNKIPNSN